MKKILIIGAGPAGIMAALTAAQKKENEITIWEKNEKPLKKILVSGNGRCNLSHENASAKNYYGSFVPALDSMLAIFGVKETIEYFRSLGLELSLEDDRYFPRTFSAASVYDVLIEAALEKGIKIIPNTALDRLEKKSIKFNARAKSGMSGSFDTVLVSTGGAAYPQLGAAGDGFGILSGLGHSIINPVPALVPLVLKKKIFNKLQGIKIKAALSTNGKSFYGDLLFTNYGLSGSAIFDLSLPFSSEIAAGKFEIAINFLPEFQTDHLKNYLSSRYRKMQNRTLLMSFAGLLPLKVAETLISLVPGLNPGAKVSSIGEKETGLLCDVLSRLTVGILSSRGFNEAQVTTGGIPLREVNPETLESKKYPGLYLAGEILDAAGECGGYNLQFAWTTGRIAGTNL